AAQDPPSAPHQTPRSIQPAEPVAAVAAAPPPRGSADRTGPPAPPAARYPALSREKAETRIEIGHVEVRLTAPARPTPARAAQRPRGPLIRPAGLFGLRQS